MSSPRIGSQFQASLLVSKHCGDRSKLDGARIRIVDVASSHAERQLCILMVVVPRSHDVLTLRRMPAQGERIIHPLRLKPCPMNVQHWMDLLAADDQLLNLYSQ